MDDNPRTNNYVEGWNRGFNAQITRSHPSIWLLIEALKRECTEARVDLTAEAAGVPAPRKSVNVKANQARLNKTCTEFNHEKPMIHYLRTIAHNILLPPPTCDTRPLGR